MEDPALTTLAAFGGMLLMVAAIAWFVSPAARSRLRRWRTAGLVLIVVVIAVMWALNGKE